MKKTFVILLLTLFASTAFNALAQVTARWGVTVGGVYNELHFKQTDIFASDRRFGPSGGLTGELMIHGVGFGFDASLLYTMRSARLHMGDRVAWSSQGIGTTNLNMHFIDVPIHLRFKYRRLGGVEDKIAPIIFAGPQFSFLVGHTKIGSPDQIVYKTTNVQLHFGIGAELFNHLQICAGYGFNVGETCRTRVLDENAAKNRTWTLTATYLF
ncbi:MAG: PorT family protein [Muribaculaceae bacterium]|nr:PorT family protein [Muribaculaceae bacterium]